MTHDESPCPRPPRGPARGRLLAISLLGLLIAAPAASAQSLAATAETSPEPPPPEGPPPWTEETEEAEPLIKLSSDSIFPLQFSLRMSFRRWSDRVYPWATIYGGLAFGSLGPRGGAFLGVGTDLAGPPDCPAPPCEAANAGLTIRVGYALRETVAGESYSGKYAYLAATPFYAKSALEGGKAGYGVRVALGFADPLRVRLIDHFYENDPTRILASLRFLLNSVELVAERCSGGSYHCPRFGAGIQIGLGI